MKECSRIRALACNCLGPNWLGPKWQVCLHQRVRVRVNFRVYELELVIKDHVRNSFNKHKNFGKTQLNNLKNMVKKQTAKLKNKLKKLGELGLELYEPMRGIT